jgi:hypothetical protein
MYSIDQLEADIIKIDRKLSDIRADRGVRYGNSDDTLANVRDADWFEDGGWRGALGSAIECINRLKVMARKPTTEIDVHDFENATDDLINYALYIKIIGRQKRVSLETPCENGDCEKGIKPFEDLVT